MTQEPDGDNDTIESVLIDLSDEEDEQDGEVHMKDHDDVKKETLHRSDRLHNKFHCR